MRKILYRILFVGVMISCIFTIQSLGASDFSYTLDDNGNAIITAYNGNESNLIIPNNIDEYNVIAINDSAFNSQSGNIEATILTDVTISEGITAVGDFAFSGCTNLESITLPSTLNSLGEFAFLGCNKLNKINIPTNLKQFGKYTFQETNFTEFVIPENFETIEVGSFRLCNNLNSFKVFSKDVVYEENVFEYCSSDLVLYGYEGSTTQTYAQQNNISFQLLTDTTEEVKVTAVSLNKTTLELEIGEEETLVAIVEPGNATNDNVTFETSDPTVATVNANGKVTAVAAGTTTITVTTEDGNKTATCTVTVNELNDEPTDEPTNVEWADFSNVKFITKASSLTSLEINVENVTLDENSSYYIYVSKNNNEQPVVNYEKCFSIFKDDEGKLCAMINSDNSRKALEEVGQNYIYVIGKNREGTEKILVNAKKMDYPALPGLGQKFDIYLYDSANSYFHNFIDISSNRTITYKIGKVTSNEILKSLKNDSTDVSFANLLDYAKNTTPLKTGTMKPEDLNYNIANDITIDKEAYYFVYMIADTENGKYNYVEDVAIYQECNDKNGNALVHFTFANIEIEEDNIVKKQFNNRQYYIFEKNMSWEEAKAYCESLGGYLVTITSAEEQAFIEGYIKEKGLTKNRFWMGATDSAKEGTWTWITGEKFIYTNWGNGQPNNREAGGQNYGVYVGKNSQEHSVYAAKWDDINEGAESDVYFICEWGELDKQEDNTNAPVVLPNTGKTICIVSIVALVALSTIGFIKYKKFSKIV